MTFREMVLFLFLVTSAILLEYFYYINFDIFGEGCNRTRTFYSYANKLMRIYDGFYGIMKPEKWNRDNTQICFYM